MSVSNLPTRAEVLLKMFQRWTPVAPMEYVPLDQVCGRISAHELQSQVTLPVVRSSIADGIAVDSARFAQGMPDTSRWVKGVDYVRADTGDDFDDRFDTVLRIEDVIFPSSGGVILKEGVQVTPGSYIRHSGGIIREGEVILRAGRPIRSADMGLLALGGIQQVPVRKQPVVAFVPTGSELIAPGAPLTRGKNIDANSTLARHMLAEMGAQPLVFPIVRDDTAHIDAALTLALERADIVVLNGGSAQGEEDFTCRMLEQQGEVLCHGVAAGPGRPICVAILQEKLVINLPGPIMSAWYGLDWCVRPAVSRYLGIPMQRRQRVTATLTQDVDGVRGIDFLIKLHLRKRSDGSWQATPLPFRTVPLSECFTSGGMMVSPVGEEGYRAGDQIQAELLCGEEYYGY